MDNLPKEFLDALGLRGSAPIEPVEHPAVNAPFGYFQRTVKPLDPDEEIDFETPVAKLFHGSTHTDDRAEFALPEINIADYEFEDRETSGALLPLKKIFSEGRYGITATSQAAIANVLPAKHDPTPTPAKTEPAPTEPTQKLGKSVLTIVEEMKRENLKAFVERRLSEGETAETLSVSCADLEVAKAIREICAELAKAKSGDIEPLSELLHTAFENVGERDGEEDDTDYFERVAQELRRLGVRPPLSTT